MFAQEAIKFEEVAVELEAAEKSIGSPADLANFFRSALTLSGAAVGQDKIIDVDLVGTKAALREALGGSDRLRIAFEPVAGSKVPVFHRTHPVVEGLASHVLNAALDPVFGGIARRAGVIRSKAVKQRTVLLLLRLRFHIVTTMRQEEKHLLAEDSMMAAFTGDLSKPEWLSDQQAEELLDFVPDANVPRDLAVNQLTEVTESLASLTPELEAMAEARGQALLEAHRRVRKAAVGKGTYRIDHSPPDLLGVYIFLPVANV